MGQPEGLFYGLTPPSGPAAWLEETATRTGVAQGQIVREQLQKAKAARGNRPFMRLAGAVRGSRTLSRRKGFSAS